MVICECLPLSNLEQHGNLSQGCSERRFLLTHSRSFNREVTSWVSTQKPSSSEPIVHAQPPLARSAGKVLWIRWVSSPAHQPLDKDVHSVPLLCIWNHILWLPLVFSLPFLLLVLNCTSIPPFKLIFTLVCESAAGCLQSPKNLLLCSVKVLVPHSSLLGTVKKLVSSFLFH